DVPPAVATIRARSRFRMCRGRSAGAGSSRLAFSVYEGGRQDKGESECQDTKGDTRQYNERLAAPDCDPQRPWLPRGSDRAVRRARGLRRPGGPASREILNSHSHSYRWPTRSVGPSHKSDQPIRFRGETQARAVKGV